MFYFICYSFVDLFGILNLSNEDIVIMDELTEALASNFYVSLDANTTTSSHPRFCQYKAKNSPAGQEERRRKFLELQKQKRLDLSNHIRCLTEGVWDNKDGEDDDDYEADDDAMEVDKVLLKRPGRNYRNQLMLSEWMIEIPDKFDEDWIMVPCPVGKRNLVIASGGQTRAYAKSGFLIKQFPSALPGGSRHVAHWKGESTILDCVFSETSRTFYILDMMSWGQHPIYDSETEFRFYWLHTKMQEVPNASEISKVNPFSFQPLENFQCDSESISKVVNTKKSTELDGLLFYHKKAAYTFGSTPLVVWLKAYMLPEILGIPVPLCFIAQAPSTYQNFSHHIETVKQQKLEATAEQQHKLKGNDGQHCIETSCKMDTAIDVSPLHINVNCSMEPVNSTSILSCIEPAVETGVLSSMEN